VLCEFGGKISAVWKRHKRQQVYGAVQPGEGDMKSEIQDAKLKRKNCSPPEVSPLSGGEEREPAVDSVCGGPGFWVAHYDVDADIRKK